MYLAKSASYPLTSQFSSKNPKGLESVFIPTFSVPRSRISSYKSAQHIFPALAGKNILQQDLKTVLIKLLQAFSYAEFRLPSARFVFITVAESFTFRHKVRREPRLFFKQFFAHHFYHCSDFILCSCAES